jgi:hypothetical protein
MRRTTIVLTVLLGAAAIAAGLHARRLDGEVASLTRRLAALERERAAPRGAELVAGARLRAAAAVVAAGAAPAAPPAAGAAPAELVTAGGVEGAWLPAPFDDEEGRAQLARFVDARLARGRGAAVAAVVAERNGRLVADAAGQLALTAAEEAQVAAILAEAQAARAAYFEELRTGQAPTTEISARMTTLRNQSHERLRALLGADRFARFVELQRAEDGRPAPPS